MSQMIRFLAVFTASLGLVMIGCKKEKDADGGTSTTTDDHGHDHDHDHDHDHGDGDDHGEHDHGDEVSLGTAQVGELAVECAQGHGDTAAGKEMHLVVKLPYTDDGASIVRAWIGTEDRLSSVVGKGEYAASHDDYDIHVEAPDPLPANAKWWIEVESPDGTKSVGSIAFN